jgi:radical SAM protein with 4Fe4S-binding SPASM domain
MSIGTFLSMELTNRCNFQCEFCYNREIRTHKDIDFDKSIEVLEKLKDISIMGIWTNRIQLNGAGEALLYPMLIESVREAKKRFNWVEIISNGFLFTENKIRELLEIDIDMIAISLTGVSAEVYSKFQGSGLSEELCRKRLEQVISNVKLLAKMKVEMHKKTIVQLRYIKSLDSKKHVKEYIKFWRGTGVDDIYITSLFNFKRKKTKERKVLRCIIVPRRFQVSADGEVFPCTCNYDQTHSFLGNVYETPFDKIITSNLFLEDKKARMSCDLNIVPESCLTCENRYLRDFYEEWNNMRQRIFYGKPVKTFFSKLFGPFVIIFERIIRIEFFYNLLFTYLKFNSAKIRRRFLKRMQTEKEYA